MRVDLQTTVVLKIVVLGSFGYDERDGGFAEAEAEIGYREDSKGPGGWTGCSRTLRIPLRIGWFSDVR